jgi:hypothetical protein
LARHECDSDKIVAVLGLAIRFVRALIVRLAEP